MSSVVLSTAPLIAIIKSMSLCVISLTTACPANNKASLNRDAISALHLCWFNVVGFRVRRT